MAYVALRTAEATPPKVRAFIAENIDLYLADTHGMLRLPVPECGITVACNFTLAGALLAVIAGVSTVLYEPETPRDRGRLFKETAQKFYPWDTEPANGVTDPADGSTRLYSSFRNLLAHTLGRGEVNEPRRISRFKGGPSEEALQDLEKAVVRPREQLSDAPTLIVEPGVREELVIEPFYWGVREMIFRITDQPGLMANAGRFL